MEFRPYVMLSNEGSTESPDYTLRVIVPASTSYKVKNALYRHDPTSTNMVYFRIDIEPGVSSTAVHYSVPNLVNPRSSNQCKIEVKFMHPDGDGGFTIEQEYTTTRFDQAVDSSENDAPAEGPYVSLYEDPASNQLTLYTLTNSPTGTEEDWSTNQCSVAHCIKHYHNPSGAALQDKVSSLGSAPTTEEEIEVYITNDEGNRKRKKRKAKSTTALSSSQPFD